MADDSAFMKPTLACHDALAHVSAEARSGAENIGNSRQVGLPIQLVGSGQGKKIYFYAETGIYAIDPVTNGLENVLYFVVLPGHTPFKLFYNTKRDELWWYSVELAKTTRELVQERLSGVYFHFIGKAERLCPGSRTGFLAEHLAALSTCAQVQDESIRGAVKQHLASLKNNRAKVSAVMSAPRRFIVLSYDLSHSPFASSCQGEQVASSQTVDEILDARSIQAPGSPASGGKTGVGQTSIVR